jgi:IclR family KDG regulon transcriptional repressor
MQNNTTIRNNDNIQSVQRAFKILEVIAAQPTGVGVTEIAQQVALPKSTVARFLSTLEGVQAIERLPAGEGYSVGAGLISLVAQVPFSKHLVAVARPFLQALAQATGETTNLCLPDGDQVHYIDQVNSLHHIQIQDWTGFRFPLHVVSSGKLFLAHWPEVQLARYLTRPLKHFAEKTITDPALLRKELQKIRAQGYAWARQEFDDEIVGLAVPLWDEADHLIASLSVGGPLYRFPPPDQSEQIVQLIVEMGRKISTHLQENRR